MGCIISGEDDRDAAGLTGKLEMQDEAEMAGFLF